MSGTVSGITKIFSSVGAGIGKAAATLGSAVRGVGASLFTAGAASGSGIASGGGFFSNILGSGSTLGNMFSGVSNILGLGGGGAASTAATTGVKTAGLGSFLESPLGEAALGGIQGWAAGKAQEDQIEAVKDLKRMDIAANERAANKITDSYNVPNSALVGGSLEASSPQAIAQATTPKLPTRKPSEMWAYKDGMIQKVPQRAVA